MNSRGACGLNVVFKVFLFYLNSGIGWLIKAWEVLCAEAKKSGPDTLRLSKKGEAMKWGV